MNIEDIRKYCLSMKGVSESFPFNEEALVFKVMSKMFLISSLDDVPLTINIKCDPEKAVERRERYDSVKPGFHMNKNHWNTIVLDGSIPAGEIFGWIDESYNLVKAGLKKSEIAALELL